MTRSRPMILIPCALSMAVGAPAQGEWRAVPDLTVRASHAMAYDVARQRVVLFGGLGGSSRNKGLEYFDDTWEWDGSDWELKTPLHSPEPREFHAMAWDPVRKSVLLFGGVTSNPSQPVVLFGDTWEWDGQDWRKLSPQMSPGPRFLAGVATDPARGRIVLFGGATSFGWFAPSLDETWEWDGSTWTQRFPLHVPARRQAQGMAYLPKTGGVVMYGGQDGIFAITDEITWEWDGQDWLAHPRPAPASDALFPPPSLGRRTGQAMTTHPSGQSVLLVEGGSSSSTGNTFETWEWDGTRWQQVTLAAAPKPVWFSIVATDLARGEVLLYGPGPTTWAFTPATRAWRLVSDWTPAVMTPCAGGTSPVVHDPLRDEFVLLDYTIYPPLEMRTWRLRDNRFGRLHPPQSPPWRVSGAMTWHGGLGKVCLFGGGGAGCGPLWNDTWLWDGNTWQEHVSAQRPPREASPPPPIVYDSRRDRIVLVAARYGPPQTWEWDVQNGWQQIATLNRPTQRAAYTMAYDPRRGRTVLFGGSELPLGNLVADTWEYDGADWRQVQTTQNPFATVVLVYIEPLGGVVAIDYGAGGFVATWLFDGQDWRKLTTDGEPAGGAWFIPLAAAYDTNRQRLRLFYNDDKAVAPAHSIWEWRIRTLDVSQPRPRLGETIRFDLGVPTQAGRPWLMGLSFADRPAIPLRPVPFVGTEVLPLAPDALLLATLQARLGGVLDPSGKGSVQVTIPTGPVLVERELYAAAVTLDASGNIGIISNGVTLEVVR